MKSIPEKQIFPAQHQEEKPGIESKMNPRPIYDDLNYKPNSKLSTKVAIVTGGDSGIGRAVSVLFAKEGASVVVVYLNEHGDAEETQTVIRKYGGKCILLSGDVGSEEFCNSVVKATIKEFGQIDVVVNNVAEQQPQGSLLSISEEQITKTFRTNV